MIEVLYDHQIFTLQKFGGISRYFYELYCNAENNYRAELSLRFSDNEYFMMAEKSSFGPLERNVCSRILRWTRFKAQKKIYKFRCRTVNDDFNRYCSLKNAF